MSRINVERLSRAFCVRAAAGVLGLLCLTAYPLAGADVVEFGDGNRLVGEIKFLDRGALFFKNETTDTISLEWADVVALTSSQKLRFVDVTGRSLVGYLEPSQREQQVIVLSDGQRYELSMLEVVEIQPLEETAWDRLNLELDAGYAFTKSTEVEQWNVGLEIDYSTAIRRQTVAINAQSSGSPDTQDDFRGSATYRTLRHRAQGWGSGWGAGVERNDALSLDYRASATFLYGRTVYPSPDRHLLYALGLQANNEEFDSGETTNSLEGVAGISFDWFRFGAPELDLNTELTLYPSLTESGRLRGAFSIDLTWEMFEKFHWRLSFYDNYDNQAGEHVSTGSTNRNDYGVRTSIIWSK